MRRFAFGLGLLVLGVLLSGCGLFGAPSPALGESPTLSGTVQRWTGSSGKIVAINMGGDAVYGEGTIDSAGRFSLRLKSLKTEAPGLLEAIRPQEGACSLKVSREGVRIALVQVLEGPGGEIVLYVDRADKPTRFAQLIYADGNVRVWTEGQCPQTLDLDLRAGWNWVVANSKLQTAFPAGFVWIVSE